MRRLLLSALAVVTATTLPAVAAGHDKPGGGGNVETKASVSVDGWGGHGIDPANPGGCDPLDPAQCMLPFPNDWFTKPDTSSATGRRVDLNALGMPHNVEGKPIEPQEWNRSDGFSAGAQILTFVPGMTKNGDIAASDIPPATDLGMNDTADDPGVVLLDTTTWERVPVWGEVDQYVAEAGPVQTGSVQQDLMIHPAVNLADGHHFIVALRHLHLDDGAIAKPAAAFQAYRDGTAPATDPRWDHMEHIFKDLRAVASAALTSTWLGTSPPQAHGTSPAASSGSATTRSPSSATAS